MYYRTTPSATLLILCLLFGTHLYGQDPKPTIDYYFPNTTFDTNIQSPSSFIGHEIGEWHLTHDRLVYYFRYLASASPSQTQLIELGTTHESRPLIAMIISSSENMAELEAIQERRQNFEMKEDDPIVIWQGYTIHGDEASGANAAPLYAYWLLAGEDEEIEKYLDNTIVIIYPCFNPDGMNRFASWVNTHKNKTLTSSPIDREYNQSWPRGRTNHYWFDLNRDWLPLSQPESQVKNELFHDWKPNILTDHHEMGKDATFFFQPGVPARKHPLTPIKNQELTEKISTYHARALDDIGSLYYTKQSYDDFYYGKGSTFPDIQGCIGILFEQASSRGHLQDTENGLLSFPFTIRNQLLTSISTLRAGSELKKELHDYQKTFFSSSKPKGGVSVGCYNDPARLYSFAQLLNKQRIQYHYDPKPRSIGGQKVTHSLDIPFDQQQGRLAEAIFDTRTSFEDSIFYDVSAFNLAQSHNFVWSRQSIQIDTYDTMPRPSFQSSETATYAYLLPWDSYHAPRALYKLLSQDIRCKVSTSKFSIDKISYTAGSILIPLQNQDANLIHQIVEDIRGIDMTPVTPLHGGSTDDMHLGNRNWKTIENPKIALLVGDGISPYDAGEVWHLLDQKYHIPVSKIDSKSLKKHSLENYNTLIINDIRLNISSTTRDYLKDWVSRGNTIIGTESATKWLMDHGLSFSNWKSEPSPDSVHEISYEQHSDYLGARYTGGAIVNTTIDLSHPLFYGYHREKLPVFKRKNHALFPDRMSYKNPMTYSDNVLSNGYMHPTNRDHLSGTAAIQVSAIGSGRVVSILDNMNFRGFWLGTDKIMANAIFFSPIIDSKSCLSE